MTAARRDPTAQAGVQFVSVRDVVKRFPGVLALDHVNLEVATRQIHALLGENGAGKSTLIKILSGVYAPDSGEVIVRGEPVTISSPHDSQELGITTIHQELTLAPDLTAIENIFLGRELRRMRFLVNDREMEARVRVLCEEFDFDLRDLHRPAGQLGAIKQHVVEIMKALAFDARLLIMDEPTSGLADHERLTLFKHMKAVRDDRGMSIVWVTHRLEELYGVADQITVLRDGTHVGTVTPDQATPQDLVKMMVGREVRSLADIAVRPDAGAGREGGSEEVLRVEGLSRSPVLKNISLTLHTGEILGIAGIAGAGRTELARAILGADRIDEGQIYIKGKPVNIRTPRSGYRHGIAIVPEERKTMGIIDDFSVARNISVASLQRVVRGGLVMDEGKEDRVATDYVKDLGIRTPSVKQRIRNLSGGNQQKAIIARCLFTEPAILIFDEPTQGIDVGAKQEVYRLIYDFVDHGGSAIVISSELPELLELSDRILVMHEGQLAGEVAGLGGSRQDQGRLAEEVMHLATRGRAS